MKMKNKNDNQKAPPSQELGRIKINKNMYNSINKYNNLDNSKVYRSELLELVKLAQEENQSFIVQKISNLLRENPEVSCFKITLKSKIPTYQIEDGLLGAFEEVPQELQEEEGKIVTDGLNMPRDIKRSYHSSIKKLYEKLNINEDLAMFYDNPSELIKKHPKVKNYIPHSYVSQKPYKGVNTLYIADKNKFQAFRNPYFITKTQIKNQKGTIKKGTEPNNLFFFTTSENDPETPIIVNYSVYTISDVEGISAKPPKPKPKKTTSRIDNKKPTKKAVVTKTEPKEKPTNKNIKNIDKSQSKKVVAKTDKIDTKKPIEKENFIMPAQQIKKLKELWNNL